MKSLLTEELEKHNALPEHLKQDLEERAKALANQPITPSPEQIIHNKFLKKYIETIEEYVAKEFLDREIKHRDSQWVDEKVLLREELGKMSVTLKLQPQQIPADIEHHTEKLARLYSTSCLNPYRTIDPKKHPKIFIETLEQIYNHKAAQITPDVSPEVMMECFHLNAVH
jgi:predicted DNA-binding protein